MYKISMFSAALILTITMIPSGCGPQHHPSAGHSLPVEPATPTPAGSPAAAGSPADDKAAPSSPKPHAVASEADNKAVASYRGYQEINRLMSERLSGGEDSVDVGTYLEPGKELGNDAPSLSDLLGTYAGDGVHEQLHNGVPNSVNMLLWYLALDGVAADVSSSCQAGKAPSFPLSSEFAAALAPLCAWPVKGTAAAADLRALWDVAMAADAPESEYDAWRAFVVSPGFGATGPEAARSMLLTMLYNPHFLLNK